MTIRAAIILMLIACGGAACGPNQRILESSNDNRPSDAEVTSVNSNSAPVPAGFDQDLESMRTADFNFIYVFRRKDGGVLDSDDRSFMNANTPYEINRKKLADSGRALIVGSNFRFPAENFKVMKERFAFEDFSKPESEIMSANANSNAP